jgi:hypothetical protein
MDFTGRPMKGMVFVEPAGLHGGAWGTGARRRRLRPCTAAQARGLACPQAPVTLPNRVIEAGLAPGGMMRQTGRPRAPLGRQRGLALSFGASAPCRPKALTTTALAR